MSIDPDTGNLYVANDMGQSILVFRKDDQGDVAPTRVIKGQKTHLSYPAGVVCACPAYRRCLGCGRRFPAAGLVWVRSQGVDLGCDADMAGTVSALLVEGVGAGPVLRAGGRASQS